MAELRLDGCRPEPLLSYLKALGVFRLVAEQVDADATLSWRGGVACLQTKLTREELTTFFLQHYRPTPIVVPWSGGDFFGVNMEGDAGPYKKAPTATRIIDAFLATTSNRFEPYRTAILIVRRTMTDLGVHSKADIKGTSKKKAGATFLATLRGRVADLVVDWIDAAYQSDGDAAVFNQFLGSGGGSDGNTHFSDNFMQNLWDCLPDFDPQRERVDQPKSDVRNALYDELCGQLTPRTGALYDSGAVSQPQSKRQAASRVLSRRWIPPFSG